MVEFLKIVHRLKFWTAAVPATNELMKDTPCKDLKN